MTFDSFNKTILSGKNLDFLREKWERVPALPGVYIHKGKNAEVLYVGKANQLKVRLRSYFFSPQKQSLKTQVLVSKIADFDIILANSSYESLILENNLIKHHKPPYNILLRDDKTYPFLKVTVEDPWPKVLMVRKKKNDGSLYFGPYPAAGQAYQLLELMEKYFPLVKCSPKVFAAVTRPCNYFDIKRCLAPCHLKVSKEDYSLHVQNAIQLLEGNNKSLQNKISQEIQKAAGQLEFEKAAFLRDQLKALQGQEKTQSSYMLDVSLNCDVICSLKKDHIFIFHLLQVRKGIVLGGKTLHSEILFDEFLDMSIQEEESHRLSFARIYSQFICQYYASQEIPPVIYFDDKEHYLAATDIKDIVQYLTATAQGSQDEQSPVQRISLVRDLGELFSASFWKGFDHFNQAKCLTDFKKILSHAQANLEHQALDIFRKSSWRAKGLQELQEILNLPKIPERMECFDISTFQGDSTVASRVVFAGAEPVKKDYRHYIITSVQGKNNDFESLKEVLQRRLASKDPLPDVLLVDGGIPQLRQALHVFASQDPQHRPMLAGIAKARTQRDFNSHVVTSSPERLVFVKNQNPAGPYDFQTVALSPHTASFQLITSLRDEAHRFAISFHRKKRNKNLLTSRILQGIPGLGPRRRKALLSHCPNLKDLLSHENLTDMAQKTSIPLKLLLLLREKIASIGVNDVPKIPSS